MTSAGNNKNIDPAFSGVFAFNRDSQHFGSDSRGESGWFYLTFYAFYATIGGATPVALFYNLLSVSPQRGAHKGGFL